MKSLSVYLCLVAIVFVSVFSTCKKSGGNSGGSTLTIETTPASGSVQAASPGPDFPLTVTITSAMPPNGVRIDITARPDGSVTPFFTKSVTSTSAVNNFSITGSPQAVVCVVDVTVTDISNSANTATSSYRFSRK